MDIELTRLWQDRIYATTQRLADDVKQSPNRTPAERAAAGQLVGTVNRAVYDWGKAQETHENAPIPEVVTVKYECRLGSCEQKDPLHDADDLYWVPFTVIEDSEYHAGWYCDTCISNEFADAFERPPQGLPLLSQEIDRRNQEVMSAKG